jgi:hypothetical protein
MKNQNQTTTTNRPNVWELPTTAEEITLCEVIRFIDLRAMHQSNGTDEALNDIIRGCYIDTLALKATDRQSRADTLKAIAKSERAIANKARQTLNRVRVTDEERTEAFHIMTHYSTLADNNAGEAHDAEKLNNSLTVSLATDMLHSIWLELQAIKADTERHTDKAFSELCKAGRHFIQSMTAVSTIDSMNCIYRPLSRQEALYYMTRYNVNPANRPRDKWTQTAKGTTGYYTLEAHTRKKDTDPKKVDPAIIANYARYNDSCIWYYENITLPTTHSTHRTAFPALDAKTHAVNLWHRMTQAQKAVSLSLDPADNPILYLVLHVPTIRTQYSTADMEDKDPRTAQAIADNAVLSVDPVKLAERAGLSHQARIAIEALTHPEAIQQARTAHREAIKAGEESLAKLQADRAEAGKKPYSPGKLHQMRKQYQTTANNAYTTALWSYALNKAGYTQTAQRKAKSVICGKLSNALRTAPDTMTPGYIDYRKLMGSTARGHADHTPHKLKNPVILLKSHTTADTDGKKHTTWDIAPMTAPGAWKPGEAMTVNYSYTDSHGNRHTWSEAVTMKATQAECTAVNPGIDYRAEEVLRRDREQIARAEARKAHAGDIARIRAEARKASEAHTTAWRARPTHTITPEEFNAMDGNTRLAFLDRIHADGKRLAFVTA